MEPLLSLRDVHKRFGDFEALRGIDLDVMPGEFMTLLGPSGCGKTTTLRLIAGLDTPDAGRVMLSGQDITALPPEKRRVNTVFQSLALFPHMTVEKNIGYGLRMQGEKKDAIAARVKEMLHVVRLDGAEKRLPSQLSGGQRQRVALARALAVRPQVLLLDEPLSALDLHLRRHMQQELKRMQRELGVTFLYITHDQEEALNMSDRVALMRDGRFVQIASPQQLYDAPESMFAAGFIGQSNLLRGVITGIGPGGKCSLEADGLAIPCQSRQPVALGEDMALCIRSERLHYGAHPHPGAVHVSGMLRALEFAGGSQRAVIELPGGQWLTAQHQPEEAQDCAVGSRVFLWWDTAAAALVPWEEGDENVL